MIANESPRRRDGQSSFRALAGYITNKKGGDERVLYSHVSNCHSDSPAWALHEIEAVQAHNTRAQGDKIYHLIVSFSPGEEADQNTLLQCVEALCQSIGLGEHLRLSAVHADTDCLHLHVAINKIHPKTFNMVEPLLVRSYMSIRPVDALISDFVR